MGVASVIRPQGDKGPDGPEPVTILTYVAVGWGVMALVARGVIAAIITKAGRDKIARETAVAARGGGLARLPDEAVASCHQQLVPLFSMVTILRSAVLDGAVEALGPQLAPQSLLSRDA